MTDSSGAAPLRTTKADASAVAKRLRALLAAELGWKGTHQQAIVLTAKAFGWRNQETMAANYLAGTNGIKDWKSETPAVAVSTPALDQDLKTLLRNAAWFLLDGCTQRENVDFHYLAASHKPAGASETLVEALAMNSASTIGVRADLIADLSLVSDRRLPFKPADNDAGRAGQGLASQAFRLAEIIWNLHPGFAKMRREVEYLASQDLHEFASAGTAQDRHGRLMSAAATYLLLNAAETAPDLPFDLASMARRERGGMTVKEQATAEMLFAIDNRHEILLHLVDADLLVDEAARADPYRAGAASLIEQAIGRAAELWDERSAYLRHSGYEPSKQQPDASPMDFEDLVKSATRMLVAAADAIAPGSSWQEAVHAEKPNGDHPLIEVEEMLAKLLAQRPHLIDVVRMQSIEWDDRIRSTDALRAGHALVNEAMDHGEMIWQDPEERKAATSSKRKKPAALRLKPEAMNFRDLRQECSWKIYDLLVAASRPGGSHEVTFRQAEAMSKKQFPVEWAELDEAAVGAAFTAAAEDRKFFKAASSLDVGSPRLLANVPLGAGGLLSWGDKAQRQSPQQNAALLIKEAEALARSLWTLFVRRDRHNGFMEIKEAIDEAFRDIPEQKSNGGQAFRRAAADATALVAHIQFGADDRMAAAQLRSIKKRPCNGFGNPDSNIEDIAHGMLRAMFQGRGHEQTDLVISLMEAPSVDEIEADRIADLLVVDNVIGDDIWRERQRFMKARKAGS